MVSREHPVCQGFSRQVHTTKGNPKVKPARRRRHSVAFKAEAVNACIQTGVPISAVALSYPAQGQSAGA